MSTKPVIKKIHKSTKVVGLCPVMWTYDICAFDTMHVLWLLLTTSRCKQNRHFRRITGNKYLSQWLDLKPSWKSGMDIMPLCIHSTLMNCFNKVIFLRFYNVIKFYILSGDGKMLGLSSVSESQFRQRLDISPLCCNLAIDVIKKQAIETNTHTF